MRIAMHQRRRKANSKLFRNAASPSGSDDGIHPTPGRVGWCASEAFVLRYSCVGGRSKDESDELNDRRPSGPKASRRTTLYRLPTRGNEPARSLPVPLSEAVDVWFTVVVPCVTRMVLREQADKPIDGKVYAASADEVSL